MHARVRLRQLPPILYVLRTFTSGKMNMYSINYKVRSSADGVRTENSLSLRGGLLGSSR